MSPKAWVAGTVVDAENEPVPGAEVMVTQGLAEPGGVRAVLVGHPIGETPTGTTGDDGRFRIEGIVGKGPFKLEARAEAWGHGVLADVQAGAEDVRLVLRPFGGMAGVVVDADGEAPVQEFAVWGNFGRGPEPMPTVVGSGGQVFFSIDPSGFGEGGFSRSFSNETGKFVINDIPAGTYSIRVDAGNFVSATKPAIEVLPGEV